jgi:hypothetical protein
VVYSGVEHTERHVKVACHYKRGGVVRLVKEVSCVGVVIIWC